MDTKNLYNLASQNFELVEINIGATPKLSYNFPQTTLFEGKKIVAMEVYELSKVAVSPLGYAVLNAAAMKNGYLTLNVNAKEKYKQMPISSLTVSNNNGIVRSLDRVIINATKSKIDFSTITGLVANESILIGVHFED